MTQDPSAAQGVAPLAPPTPLEAPFALTAPEPVKPVALTAAPAMAPAVDPQVVPGLDAKVDSYLSSLTASPAGSPQFAAQAADVRTMGDADIRHAAESSNRLLQTPVNAIREGGLASGSKVGSTLLDLRRTVEDLDPSGAQGARKILGFIPIGDKIVDYFRKYQSAQSHLDAILHALRDGQDELRRDNVALTMEKTALWEAMGRLNQYVYVSERLDARLSAAIADLEATDPDRARALRDDVLFYVRQKHQDLLTQLSVSIQNYLAIDILVRTTSSSSRASTGPSTTTMSALRTAVIVSQALSNQKLVLDQIIGPERHHVRPHRAHVGHAQGQLRGHPAAGGLGHDRPAPAAGRVREHLRDDGRHRLVQGAGPGLHGRHDRHPGDRGRQVPELPRPACSSATSGSPRGRSTSTRPPVGDGGRSAIRQANHDGTGGVRMGVGDLFARLTGRAEPERAALPSAPTADDLEAALGRVEAMVAGGAVPAPVASRVAPGRAGRAGHHAAARPPRRGLAGRVRRDGHRHRLPARGGWRLPAAAARVGELPPGRQRASRRCIVLVDQLDLLGRTMDQVLDAVTGPTRSRSSRTGGSWPRSSATPRGRGAQPGCRTPGAARARRSGSAHAAPGTDVVTAPLADALAALSAVASAAGVDPAEAAPEGARLAAAVAESSPGAAADWSVQTGVDGGTQAFFDAATRGRRWRAAPTDHLSLLVASGSPHARAYAEALVEVDRGGRDAR